MIIMTGISLKKFFTVAMAATAGTVAAFGAVAIASSAASMPNHKAAETHAVPLALTVMLAGSSLMIAAAAATDEDDD
jgi:heme/copper-type cytochrome/quinol oxidase subunit 3